MQINLFQKTCPVCKGKGHHGETNEWTMYNRALMRGECPVMPMYQWKDCRSCKGTGLVFTTSGFIKDRIVDEVRRKVKDKLRQLVEKI